MYTLQNLLDRCRAGVYITVNAHKDNYDKAEDYIKEQEHWRNNVTKEEKERMIESNTIIELQCYPDNPVGFYLFAGNDIQDLIDRAVKAIDEERA